MVDYLGKPLGREKPPMFIREPGYTVWNIHTHAYVYMQDLCVRMCLKLDLCLYTEMQICGYSPLHINMNVCVYIYLPIPEIDIYMRT